MIRPRSHDGRRRSYTQFARRARIAVLSLAVLMHSGCIPSALSKWKHNGFKVGPNYGKPPAPAASEWFDTGDVSIQDRSIPKWWTSFNDPILNDLIESSYGQNLTLRAAGTRILQARAQQAIAVGDIFPQSQQAIGQYSRINISQNIANNPTSISGLLPPGTPNVFSNYYSDWRTGFNLSWELDFWGRFRRNIESANAILDASVEDYDAALVTLQADIAGNYTRYRVAQQRIAIARANVRVQEDILALAEEKFRVGTTTRLDVEQARTVLEQTRAAIPALEIELGRANDVLCVLQGIPPQSLTERLGPGPATDVSPLPTSPAWIAAGIPADLIRQRPDIRSAERQIAAQSAQIGVAEADLYPSFYIDGTIGYQSEDLSNLLESQSFMGTIVPNFRWNILNYGRVANNVRLQEARTLELIATYQQTVLTAGQEVQTSLRAFVKSREQADYLQRSVAAASSASKLGFEEYRVGTTNFNTVFNLEVTQVGQQDQLAIAQGTTALSLIDVYRSLGGGWEARLEPTRLDGAIGNAPTACPSGEPILLDVAPSETMPTTEPHTNSEELPISSPK